MRFQDILYFDLRYFENTYDIDRNVRILCPACCSHCIILNTTDYILRFAYIFQTLLAKKSRNAETHLSKFLTKHCQHRSILPYQLRFKISIAQQILLRRQCLAFAIINSMAFGSGQSALKYAFYTKFDQHSTGNGTVHKAKQH